MLGGLGLVLVGVRPVDGLGVGALVRHARRARSMRSWRGGGIRFLSGFWLRIAYPEEGRRKRAGAGTVREEERGYPSGAGWQMATAAAEISRGFQLATRAVSLPASKPGFFQT